MRAPALQRVSAGKIVAGRRWPIAGIMVLLWLLVGYILYPALMTLKVSLDVRGRLGVAHYTAVLLSDSGGGIIANSVVMGLWTVVVCILIGTALAFLVHYFEFPWRALVDKLLLLPLTLPGIIIVFAFVQLYGESGLVTKGLEWLLGLQQAPYDFSGLPGILFVHAYTQYVYVYLSVSIAIRHMDRSVIESARNLGAGDWAIFTTIILPFITPALITSAIITFMTGIGSFTAPSIIGGRFKVLTTQILLAKANNFMGVAAAQVMILTGISLVVFILFRWYEKRTGFAASVRGTPFRPVRIERAWLRVLMRLFAGALMASILLPVVTIVTLSFVESSAWMVSVYPRALSLENYLAIFTKSRTFEPFLNSIVMSLLAALLCLAVAVPAVHLIVKARWQIGRIIELLVMLPWAMPATAIAINLINATGTPTIFSLNAVLVGTSVLLPLAYFIRALPLVMRTANLAFEHLNDTYVDASRSLGASKSQTLGRVILPILSPWLLAGFLLVFIRSIGEYNLSAFLYTAGNRPVSIAMVNAIFEYDIGLAMAYGTLLILLTGCLSLLIGRLTSRPA
jgi:iron(III) transport system permease protein